MAASASTPTTVAVYGTLMPCQGTLAALGVASAVDPQRPCRIPGRMLTNGRYPCLVSGKGTVKGHLLRVRSHVALGKMDLYEGFHWRKPGRSLFVRERIPLADPKVTAWIWRYTGPTGHLREVPHGDWLAWLHHQPAVRWGDPLIARY